MDNDDVLVGRLLSRREMLALLGAGGMALVIGCSSNDKPAPTAQATSAGATGETAVGGTSAVVETETAVPACVVTPALTEGPYFVDEMLNRSDIRSDPGSGEVRDGAELTLTLNVYHVTNSCGPLEGATVNLWHCDAQGVYSDVTDNAEGFQTVGQKFLRGYQTTDSSGQVKFTTIYPGWYQGRATHIHFKVRKDNQEFTSQFFFDDALSDKVQVTGAYADKGAAGRLQNDRDGIYGQSGGQLLLDVSENGSGYAATFEIGLQMS